MEKNLINNIRQRQKIYVKKLNDMTKEKIFRFDIRKVVPYRYV